MSKSIFASKTFWFNVLTAVASFSGYLPAKYAVAVSVVANVGLRLVSDQPVHVISPQ